MEAELTEQSSPSPSPISVDAVSAEPFVCVTSLAVSDTDVTLEGVRECDDVMTEAGLREDSPEESRETKEESEQEEGVRVSEMEGREGRCWTFCEDDVENVSESGPESDEPVLLGVIGVCFWLTGILLGDVRGDVCPVLRNRVCAGTVAIRPGAELYLNRGKRLGGVAWLPILTLFCLSSERWRGKLLLA